MSLARYRKARLSSFTPYSRSLSNIALQKLTYHTSKKATLEPMSSANEGSSKKNDGEPIDDIGVPAFLTTVPVVHNKNPSDIKFADTPALSSAPKSDADWDNVIKKLDACCLLPDFADPDADRTAKTAKTKALKELATIFENEEIVKTVPGNVMDSFFGMIKTNIFRGIPLIARKFLAYDEEPALMDIAWPHLLLVYGLLYKVYKFKPDDDHFDLRFERKLLYMFRAPDPNERDQILTLFKEIIATKPDREASILTELGYMIVQYRESERQYEPFAVTPGLLLFAARIPNPKFDSALAKSLLKQVLIPLISSRHIATHGPLLLTLFHAYIEKNQGYALELTKEMLARWPASKPSKQVFFVNSIISLTEKIPTADFDKVVTPLFKVLANCAVSRSAKIAEASFKIWSNVAVIPNLLDHARLIFPFVHRSVTESMKTHWHNSVRNSALEVLKSMHDLDPIVFDELSSNTPKNGQATDANARGMAAHKNWALVARTAAKIDREVNLARVLADLQVRFSKPADVAGGGTWANSGQSTANVRR